MNKGIKDIEDHCIEWRNRHERWNHDCGVHENTEQHHAAPRSVQTLNAIAGQIMSPYAPLSNRLLPDYSISEHLSAAHFDEALDDFLTQRLVEPEVQ